jgi:hypothetical protein
MILIVASNLLKIAINHPGAVMAGDPPAQADSLDAGITKESVTGVSQ